MPKTVNTKELLLKLNELQYTYSKLEQVVLKEHEINRSWAKLMNIIGEEEKTLKEITEESGLDKSTISRQVNALVAKKLVNKSVGEDKRFVYFTLAQEAEQKFNEYQENVQHVVDHSLSGWTEEEKQMLSVLLGRLNRSLSNELK